MRAGLITKTHRLLPRPHKRRGLVCAGAVALLAAGCWAEIQQRTGDSGPVPGEDRGPGADLGPGAEYGGGVERGVATEGGSTGCTAGEFVRCTAPDQVQKCDHAGSGLILVNCYPGWCSEALKRCANCDPSQPPQCRGTDVVTCTADGLEKVENCAGICTEGICCLDGDADQHSTCEGDCNDADADVFPGQTEYQTVPSAGSFDYNCDGQEELQYPDTSTPCAMEGTECTGGGWQSAVPKCGEQADLVQCIARPNQCATKTVRELQGCR